MLYKYSNMATKVYSQGLYLAFSALFALGIGMVLGPGSVRARVWELPLHTMAHTKPVRVFELPLGVSHA